jgi:cytochrome P450
MASQHEQSLSLSNLSRSETRANPYPLYHELRSEDPVHWDEPMGFWVLTRHADLTSALKDKRFVKGRGVEAARGRLLPEGRDVARPVFEAFSRSMLYADPPYHTRLRGLVNKAFTPAMVAGLRPTIQGLTDELLDAGQGKGRMDIIEDLAFPLPCTVILQMLGLPVEGRDLFKKWSDDLFAALGVVRRDAKVFDTARASLSEATRYIRAFRQQRDTRPEEGLLSELCAVVEEGDRLDDDELVSNSIVLLGAGHETTTNLIGNGLLALMRNPDRLQELRENPSLMPAAVEELLRYDNPVQIVWRYAAEDVEIDGRLIREGQFLNLVIGAANRDPAEFADPDRLDFSRDESRHLGFGLGPHFCIGAALARLEGQIALETVLRRLPRLRLESEDLEWQESPTFRGVKSLPVAF